MKKRIGFISNSSSTSFIVATNKKCEGEVEITFKVKINLNDFLNSDSKVITTKKEWDSYIENYYNQKISELNPNYKKIYQKGLNILKKKYCIYVCIFSGTGDGGSGMEVLIHDNGLKGSKKEFVVLDSWKS